MLTSRKDRNKKLYVEIKGMMTYLEVNKLNYLLNETGKDFYILQLTELDRMNPYKGNTATDAYEKSKRDFETQVQELVDFVKGYVACDELSKRSKKRLQDYINYRADDLERWKPKANKIAEEKMED